MDAVGKLGEFVIHVLCVYQLTFIIIAALRSDIRHFKKVISKILVKKKTFQWISKNLQTSALRIKLKASKSKVT